MACFFFFFPYCCSKVPQPSRIISNEKVVLVLLLGVVILSFTVLNSPSALNEFPLTELAIKQRGG